MEEGTDMSDYFLATAGHMILSVYSDHLHRNNGSHLELGVANKAVWQRRWKHIKNLCVKLYDAPRGCIMHHFVQQPTAELKGVQTRGWNSEHPLVFASIILPMT